MFGLLKSLVFGRVSLAEDNVIKGIHECLGMIMNDHFAKEHHGVAIFLKREELKNAFIEYIENQMRRVVKSENPHREFRQKIIDTVKVEVINNVLLGEEFEHGRDKICEAINKGIKTGQEKPALNQAMVIVKDAEMFFDQPWGEVKLVHESAWMDVQGMVLRHLQVMVFEHVDKKSDWWEIYRKIFEKYITDFYRLVIAKDDIANGFPHPMVAAMGNETLTNMEELILEKAGK